MTYSMIRQGTLAAVIGCLGLLGSAYAQTQTASPPEPKAGAQQSGATSMPSATPGKSETAASAFEKMDAAHKGFLTKAETAKLSGFDAAFDKADSNHDGKLSQSEFNVAWSAYTAAK